MYLCRRNNQLEFTEYCYQGCHETGGDGDDDYCESELPIPKGWTSGLLTPRSSWILGFEISQENAYILGCIILFVLSLFDLIPDSACNMDSTVKLFPYLLVFYFCLGKGFPWFRFSCTVMQMQRLLFLTTSTYLISIQNVINNTVDLANTLSYGPRSSEDHWRTVWRLNYGQYLDPPPYPKGPGAVGLTAKRWECLSMDRIGPTRPHCTLHSRPDCKQFFLFDQAQIFANSKLIKFLSRILILSSSVIYSTCTS